MKKYCLYIHINKQNGKVYIGISCNPLIRWRNGFGYKSNKHFWAAIQKYGWDGFLHIIVRTDLTLKEAHEQERRWIYLYRADDRRFGYNQTKGGEGRDFGKDCYGEGGRIRHTEYIEAHRDEIRKRTKEYLRSYREKNKEKTKSYNKEYYEKNKEKAKEYMKIYREKNKEKTKEYMRLYREKHKIDNGTKDII